VTDEQLALAEEVIRAAIRRHRLAATEADEFAGVVRLKLVENRVIEKFERRSSLRTFLTTVVEHQYLDFRNQQWGKWRPSLEAKRLGPVALRLEVLLVRDGLRFDEAYEMLRTTHGISESRDELYAMSARLPRRNPRRFVGEDALQEHADPVDLEASVLQTEQGQVAGRMFASVERALAELAPTDRLLLKMHFYDGLSLADVARALGKPQKPLYRLVEGLLARLRDTLESEGFRAEEVNDLLGRDFPARPGVITAARENSM
jgi:RNA polymerase sigma factor (sigma-70 family)